ncbi:helix-turn-helix domain-containing protein [Sporolactobacillus laevolacticus]|uniref:DNA-binding protein n=1 Tax=Sporolactobacillus laevolacticus DSM 442 TaxID=1395513 RepID=V6IVD7_9BACL|nr:helix-turn-helix domain-containing protein [Sporolactobacillus laevolacticus]EST11117.1 DNA-binding protein [Sporolactobacillus laevolacticus DSM 442]
MLDKDRMNTVECAEYIGVSRTTIYTMVRHKEIPFWRARNQIMFSKKVIDDWKLKQQQDVMTGS